MNAAQAYRSIISGQLRRRNDAHADGWCLPEYHESHVIMRNRKTGQEITGLRKWSTSANRWSKRVLFEEI